jgi:serine/threonine protein kinase
MRTPAHRRFAQQGTLPPGTRLGSDLTLLGVLGEGGTGVVYRAHHSVLRREVAVKMCHAVGAGEPELFERLVREARMCASVKDVRVPRIYALDKRDDGTPYLVMEKVEGESLSELLKRGQLHARVVCQLAIDLLFALEAVHRAQVIHRDVKPSNLIIDLTRADAPRVRLLDFGIGKAMSSSNLRRSPALTRPGEVVGTPMYMAPEQMLEGAIDPRVDVYAAGIVLYEMLTGRPPFRAPSVAETFVAVLHDEMPRLDTLRPGLPAALVELVHKATSRRPDGRYASASEMRIALQALLPEMEQVEIGAPLLLEQNDEQSPTLVWRRDPQVEASGSQRRGARPLPWALARTLRKADGSTSRSGARALTPVGFRAIRRAPICARGAGWLEESASL